MASNQRVEDVADGESGARDGEEEDEEEEDKLKKGTTDERFPPNIPFNASTPRLTVATVNI
ncbi:hypothetical protein ACG7TL_005925 [Trametes sanguinea]